MGSYISVWSPWSQDEFAFITWQHYDLQSMWMMGFWLSSFLSVFLKHTAGDLWLIALIEVPQFLVWQRCFVVVRICYVAMAYTNATQFHNSRRKGMLIVESCCMSVLSPFHLIKSLDFNPNFKRVLPLPHRLKFEWKLKHEEPKWNLSEKCIFCIIRFL